MSNTKKILLASAVFVLASSATAHENEKGEPAKNSAKKYGVEKEGKDSCKNCCGSKNKNKKGE